MKVKEKRQIFVLKALEQAFKTKSDELKAVLATELVQLNKKSLYDMAGTFTYRNGRGMKLVLDEERINMLPDEDKDKQIYLDLLSRYGKITGGGDGSWAIRPSDDYRASALEKVEDILAFLGGKL